MKLASLISFIILVHLTQAKTLSELTQECETALAENPGLALDIQCHVPGESEPEALPMLTLEAVPDKCVKNEVGFYTQENYKDLEADLKNIEVQDRTIVTENFKMKNHGYWCTYEGQPIEYDFELVKVYTGSCWTPENQKFICLVKVEPEIEGQRPGHPQAAGAGSENPEATPQASQPSTETQQQQQSSKPSSFLLFLQTIILFPFFLTFCWILPFLGTIFSKTQHEKWITFWILNMLIEFLLVPILELIFYSPSIMLIRIVISVLLVFIIKHSLVIQVLTQVKQLLDLVDTCHGLVKAEYEKIKAKAVEMSENMLGK